MPRVGLLQAARDPHLLGFEPRGRQAELLAAIEAHPVVIACCGRRSGKTIAAAAAALWNLLLSPELDRCVRPGEERYAVSVANSQEQARIFVDHARALVQRSPLLRAELVEETRYELRFRGGRSLVAFPCSARTGRGWPISFLCLDELAHFLDVEEGGPQVAERVWAAMVPSTAQFGPHGRVVAMSTPLGQDGLFAELYHRASAGEIPGATAFHASTREMNPDVSEGFLQAQERILGSEDFAREYLAAFAAGGAGFLDSERIEAAVADRAELPPGEAFEWVAGLDPAFSRDPFALCLVGRDYERGLLVLGLARRWLPAGSRAGFEERRQREDELLAEVADVCLRYRARVVTDQFCAPAVVGRLRQAGLHVRAVPMSAASKTAAFAELRARLYQGQLELYPEPRLLAELRRLRSRYEAGRAAVVNPRVGDSHGDLAQALALAVLAHGHWRAAPSPRVEEALTEEERLRRAHEERLRRRRELGETSSIWREWQRMEAEREAGGGFRYDMAF